MYIEQYNLIDFIKFLSVNCSQQYVSQKLQTYDIHVHVNPKCK